MKDSIVTVVCIFCPSLLSLKQPVSKSPTMAGAKAAATVCRCDIDRVIYIYGAGKFE